MKKIYLIAVLFFCFLFIIPSKSTAINLMESYFLKITVIDNGIEYQWEYTSPGRYEFEKGEKVIKSQVAKEEMHKLLNHIELSEKVKIEKIVEKLKEDCFPELEHLDIRWMNGEQKLYTWVWDKDK